jgi:hypothetical protein
MSVKIIKKGSIDMNSFGTKRQLGFTVDQFTEFFSCCKTRPAPTQEPEITTAPEHMKPKIPTEEDLLLPFIGDE